MFADEAPYDADSAAVSAAADRTVPLAEALEPDTFFLAAHSANGRALVLAFAAEPSTAIRQQLEEAARPVPLEFRIVAHSWPQLRQVMDQITQDSALWEAQGAQLSSLGPAWTSNKVHIGLVKYEPVVAQAIEAHYGRDLVEVLTRDEPYIELC
jgi:hypothetical protein